MTIEEFLKKYNNVKSDAGKKGVVLKVIKPDCSLGIAEKYTVAHQVASASCTNSKGDFEVDSLKNMYLRTIAIITNYTTLEIGDSFTMTDYDILNDNGIIGIILDNINEHEIKDLDYCIKMATDDYIVNHTGFQTWVNELVNKISPTIDRLQATLNSLSDEQLKMIFDSIKG